MLSMTSHTHDRKSSRLSTGSDTFRISHIWIWDTCTHDLTEELDILPADSECTPQVSSICFSICHINAKGASHGELGWMNVGICQS